MADARGGPATDEDDSSFAGRLNYLFATVYPASSGRSYSNPEVAAALTADGESISSSYVWMLRTKRRENPSMRTVAAFAKFFGVPASYFFDNNDAEEVRQQLSILPAARAADVKEICYRSAQLDEPDRESILRILRRLASDKPDRDRPKD